MSKDNTVYTYHTDNLTLSFEISYDFGDDPQTIIKVSPKDETIQKREYIGQVMYNNPFRSFNAIDKFEINCPLSHADLGEITTFLKYLDKIDNIKIRGATLDSYQLANICLLARGAKCNKLAIHPSEDLKNGVIIPAFDLNDKKLSQLTPIAFNSLPENATIKLQPSSINKYELAYLIKKCGESKVAKLDIYSIATIEIEDLLELTHKIPKGLEVVLNSQNLAEIEASIPQHPSVAKTLQLQESRAAAWAEESAKYGIHI
jgi:hypothetical protein